MNSRCDTCKMSLTGNSNENVPNEEIQNVLVCPHCDQEPCVWVENREAVVVHVQHKELSVADNYNMANNEKRRHCYQFFSRVINGVLGRGNRIPLPSCVVDGVRETYPNEEGMEHMGFLNN